MNITAMPASDFEAFCNENKSRSKVVLYLHEKGQALMPVPSQEDIVNFVRTDFTPTSKGSGFTHNHGEEIVLFYLKYANQVDEMIILMDDYPNNSYTVAVWAALMTAQTGHQKDTRGNFRYGVNTTEYAIIMVVFARMRKLLDAFNGYPLTE